MGEALWNYANMEAERLLRLFYGVSASFLSPADRRNANWNRMENIDPHVFMSAYVSVRRRGAGEGGKPSCRGEMPVFVGGGGRCVGKRH